MFATALALIAQEFEGRERATAFGIWGATVGGAVAIGPLVGGALTDGLGWEWIFFVNVPIGIAAIALTETKVGEVAATDAEPIDWAGVVDLLARRCSLLIFALVRGNAEGWGSCQIVGSLVGAAVLMAAFVAIEMRAPAPDARPLAVPRARPSSASRSSPSRSRPRCSRCSSTSRSTSRTCSALGRSRPGCASCRSRCSRSSPRRSPASCSTRIPVRAF